MAVVGHLTLIAWARGLSLQYGRTNLIERWFKERTDRRLRRATFTSVVEFEYSIQLWSSHWNEGPTPFIWKATAAEMLEKVQRGRAALNRQINSETDR